MARKLLICGGTGFIGRNLVERLAGDFDVFALHHDRPPFEHSGVTWVQGDLRSAEDVDRVVRDAEVIIQAASTTSGAKDIVTMPHHHVTDNAVMNALLFRAAHDHGVGHVVFLSCTTMYPSGETPVRESDFTGEILDKYYGGGWTKVYNEKMCEFYSRIGTTRYTVIRHSNIYGPYDKFDLERSHVFGATITKVVTNTSGTITVWGDGSDERDLLHVHDLVDFIDLVLDKQKENFELVNLGSGEAVTVADLVRRAITASGRDLDVSFDLTKPSIGFKLRVNSDRARERFGWEPQISLDDGIRSTLAWVNEHVVAGT